MREERTASATAMVMWQKVGNMKAGETLIFAVLKTDYSEESSCEIRYGQDKRKPTKEDISIAIAQLIQWQNNTNK